jgi:phenylacetate-CoA ligase
VEAPGLTTTLSRLYWSAYLAAHSLGQARYAFRPIGAIKRDQARRVQSMAAYAYRHVPYYRETMDRLGLRLHDFRDAHDLARLPILERAQLQRDPEYFVSDAVSLKRCLRERSGGSSGERCTVFHDPGAVFQNAAHGERERSLITELLGRRWGYRETVIASPDGSTFNVQRFTQQHGLFPRGVRIERQYLSVLDEADKNIHHLNEFKPDIINSYGSYLGTLFRYLQATRVPFHRPKAVTYSSDGMQEGTRRSIAQDFGIPVFSTYEAIEAFKIGFECQQHVGLHLNVDLYPVWILGQAGQALPAGESGDVVVSNLLNRASVLLNYRLGDIAAIMPTPCPCGRSLPLMSFVQGRSDDLIELASGRLVHPEGIRLIFCTDREPIWQYQVLQRSESHFTVKLVVAEDCDREATRARIAADFVRKFGPEITTDISFVDAVDRTGSGKLRPVISVRQQEGVR